jgi:hypothetical protein
MSDLMGAIRALMNGSISIEHQLILEVLDEDKRRLATVVLGLFESMGAALQHLEDNRPAIDSQVKIVVSMLHQVRPTTKISSTIIRARQLTDLT